MGSDRPSESPWSPTAGMSATEHISWIASLRNRALSPPLVAPQLCLPKHGKAQAQAAAGLMMAPRCGLHSTAAYIALWLM